MKDTKNYKASTISIYWWFFIAEKQNKRKESGDGGKNATRI